MIKKFVPLLFILLLPGCTTLNVKKQEAHIYELIQLINNGDSEKLIASSSIPFLYDNEIVLLQKDINFIWKGLSEAGFSIHVPVIENIEYIDGQSYSLFSPSMEGKMFFKRHLPENTVLTTVSTKDGTFYFLTRSKKKGVITIFGMKGPIQ